MSATKHRLPKLSPVTRQFVARTIDVSTFGHREHIQVAFDLLQERDYFSSVVLYVSEIKALAERAGAPEKFHMTITLAFLNVIAERLEDSNEHEFDHFLKRNPDLMDKRLLLCWYSEARLFSDLARRQFVMPDLRPLA